MSPSFQRQIMDFCNGKNARTMREVLRAFDQDGYCLADLSKKEFTEIMKKLAKAHKQFMRRKHE